MSTSTLRIGNAAGFVKGPGPVFDDLLRSPIVTDITVGSITLEARSGNSGNTYHIEEDGTSLNALGLPNPGAEAVRACAEEMRVRAEAVGKNIRWSIAGFAPEEYAVLADTFEHMGDIELNLGCPNVWKGEKQKPIASLNPRLIEDIVIAVGKQSGWPVDLKLSPYSDPYLLQEVASVIRSFRLQFRHIVTCNTFANGVAYKEDGAAALDTANGYGGVAGNALHPIALGQVRQFWNELSDTGIHIVGVGGVSSGRRYASMLRAGASWVQVGTAFGERKARVFSDIAEEYVALSE